MKENHNKYEVPCTYCGKVCERMNNQPATCFVCKTQKRKVRSLKLKAKKKIVKKRYKVTKVEVVSQK